MKHEVTADAVKYWLLGDPRSEDEQARIGMLNLRGMSIADLGRTARLSSASIYKYLSGKSFPTEENLQRICTALHVPYAEGAANCRVSKVGRPFKNSTAAH